MSNWLRKAQINKGMIVALAVLVLVSGVFWTYKCRNKSSEVEQSVLRYKSYYITCTNCGVLPDPIPSDKVKEMNADTKHGFLKCPKCGQYTAKWGRRPAAGQQPEDTGTEQNEENP